MDYVLFGMGYGATLMLLGWALRTFGPERKYKSVDPDDEDRRAEQLSWVRFIQGLGGVVAIAGSALVLLTFIVMLVNPEDNTGSVTAMIIWIFVAAGILAWCWVYFARFGISGIWSRAEGYGFRNGPAPLGRSSSLSSSAERQVSSARSTAAEEGKIPPVTEEHITREIDRQDDVRLEEEEVDVAIDLDVSASAPAGSEEVNPAYDFGDSTDTTVPAEVGGRAEAIRRLRERQSKS